MRMTPEILARMSEIEAKAKADRDADRNRPLTVGEFHDGIDRIVSALSRRDDLTSLHRYAERSSANIRAIREEFSRKIAS